MFRKRHQLDLSVSTKNSLTTLLHTVSTKVPVQALVER